MSLHYVCCHCHIWSPPVPFGADHRRFLESFGWRVTPVRIGGHQFEKTVACSLCQRSPRPPKHQVRLEVP